MATDTDRVAVALRVIRASQVTVGKLLDMPGPLPVADVRLVVSHDSPLLAAALEAVLEAVTNWEADAAATERRAEDTEDPRAYAVGLSYRAQALNDCAAEVRDIAAAKLLGEEADRG